MFRHKRTMLERMFKGQIRRRKTVQPLINITAGSPGREPESTQASSIRQPSPPQKWTIPLGKQKPNPQPHHEARDQEGQTGKNSSGIVPDFSHVTWEGMSKLWDDHQSQARPDSRDLASKVFHYLFKGSRAKANAKNPFIKGYQPLPEGTHPFATGSDLLSLGDNLNFNQNGSGMARYLAGHLARHMGGRLKNYVSENVDWKQEPPDIVKDIMGNAKEHYNAFKGIASKTKRRYDTINRIQERASNIAWEHYKDSEGKIAYGEGNAFMHYILSYLLTKEFGEKVAKEITDANEVIPAGFYNRHDFKIEQSWDALFENFSKDTLYQFYTSFRNFLEEYGKRDFGINEADRKADLYNNWRGRRAHNLTKDLEGVIRIFKDDARQGFVAIPKIPPGWNR